MRDYYSEHFFRREATTSTREAGLSDDKIILLDRWKSDSYRLYITTYLERILITLRRHQHLPFHQH